MPNVISSQKVPDAPYVPGFRLMRKIGSGASGEVWIARNEVDEKVCAMKVVRIDGLDRGVWFKTELKALRAFAKLDDRPDSLIEILHVGEYKNGGYLYYTMPPADGIGGVGPEAETYSALSLGVRLRKEKMLSLPESAEIAARIVAALQALHANKLLHRDVKPDNVLFLKGKAVLADIGLVTLDRTLVSCAGTPKYMEPRAAPSVCTDLYAAGKVLYEMISGKDPVDDFPACGSRDKGDKDIRLYRPLNHICLRACGEKRPRYKSASEMLLDIEEALDGGSGNAGPARANANCSASNKVSKQELLPAKQTTRRKRKHTATKKRKGTEIVITIPVPEPIVKAYDATATAIETAKEVVVVNAPAVMQNAAESAKNVKDVALYEGWQAEVAAAKASKKMLRKATKTGGQILKSAKSKLEDFGRSLHF